MITHLCMAQPFNVPLSNFIVLRISLLVISFIISLPIENGQQSIAHPRYTVFDIYSLIEPYGRILLLLCIYCVYETKNRTKCYSYYTFH